MDRLKPKRAARRGQITRLVNEVKDLRADGNASKTTLSGLLARLEASDRDLKKINDEIEPFIKEEDLAGEYETVLSYEEQAANAIAELQTRLSGFQCIERQATSAPSESPAVLRINDLSEPGVRLPKLQLTTFSGKLTEWQPFWEQFKIAVHENRRLSKTEKFQYLTTSLKGRAAAAIRGLQVTEGCYDDAVVILKQRFGDTRLIEREYLANLRTLPAVKSAKDVSGLRSLYDHLQANMRGLKAIGVSMSSYASMMVDVLLSALPTELVVDYHRYARYGKILDGDPTEQNRSALTETGAQAASSETTCELTKVLDFVRTELESLERSGVKDSTTPSRKPYNGVRRRMGVPTGAVLQTSMERCPKCVFCASSDHDTLECEADIPVTDKIKTLSKDMRCFRCTKRGHRAQRCYAKVTCSNCGKRHARVVCDPSKFGTRSVEMTNLMAANHQQKHDSEVLLQTFRVWASSSTACIQLRGVFDGGSQRTFVREDIARKLKLKVVGESRLQINTFANDAATNKVHLGKVVELRLRSQHRPNDYIVRATTIPFICKDLGEVPADLDFVDCLRQEGQFLADDVLFPNVQCEAGIGLLVGSDEMWKLLTGEVKRYGENEKLVAVGTVFGWTFQGPTQLKGITGAAHSTTAVCVLKIGSGIATEPDILTKFWELESIGITEEPRSNAEYDASVLDEFQKNIRFVDGRYEVALPWKTGAQQLEDNYEVAYRRLKGLVSRLTRDDTVQTYDEVIRRYLQDGHAEKVPVDSAPNGLCYYMPHRAVVRSESTTTKVRVVFDASSHASGTTSLNDNLEKGPKIGADLVPVLLRFRMFKVAVTADIQKAFLQISIREEDRDALRFLWFTEAPTTENPSPNLECWRMTRVPFGTTASPFLLTATLQHHLRSVEECDRSVANKLIDAFYVDDLLVGTSDVEEAKELVQRATDILQEAGMTLSKWGSNSPEIQSVFLKMQKGCTGQKSLTGSTQTKVLGVVWDRVCDELEFSVDHLLDVISDMKDSKRSILRASARLYDPLGFLAPYTVRVKLLFQELWRAKLDWDARIPDNLEKIWHTWRGELPDLHVISVKRCLLPKDGSVLSSALHIFTDASPHAYGACAFLRSTSETGETAVHLLFAKSRVAPLKEVTLPRMELLGAVIGVRIAKFLSVALSLSEADTTFWTDSTITLNWIQSDARRWKPFVRNRVAEIQEHSDQHQWKHCPGPENPADALTRGLSVKALSRSKQWFEGPEWLSKSPESWPRLPRDEAELFESLEEEQVKAAVLTVTDSERSPLFELSGYSNYNRVIRITAWVRRFVQNCRNRVRTSGPLSASEIEESELFWVKEAQREAYPKEVAALSLNQHIDKSSKVAQFQPFMDAKGVMRLTGRLQYSDNSEAIKHPILMPKAHALSKLIASSAHQATLHGGVQLTMSTLRERWWIMQARQLVKATIHSCNTCARFRTRRATAPTAPLPADRTDPTHPFETTGVDFAGPLYVKTSSATSSKSYIALFTCFTTRAVHLELVTDLTARAFLMAFRRFISRRGIPCTMYSDNALTFKRASRDIQDLWRILRSTESQEYVATKRITWKFIVERAAWWGGVWERMVRTVKNCLRRILGRQCFTFEELNTLLHEVEAVVNSRPLTFLHSTPDEPAALTPAHFLTGKTLTALPEQPTGQEETSSARSAVKRWRHRQKMADMFWSRWRREYLLELRSAHLSHVGGIETRISEGDVMLLQEDKAPRHLWRLARVTELYHGRDGNIRACQVRLPNGTLTRRPVQLLYPLELSVR